MPNPLQLQRVIYPAVTLTVGDTTPGGVSDVWLWEPGIGLLWETEIYMLTE